MSSENELTSMVNEFIGKLKAESPNLKYIRPVETKSGWELAFYKEPDDSFYVAYRVTFPKQRQVETLVEAIDQKHGLKVHPNGPLPLPKSGSLLGDFLNMI